ncbi:CspA family cold shock protein [Cytobacillus eiseniae]|uniref:CspA family cold shock protein n=1 Tax=Cytobacillus eiseniae TaxID=762947 RepID=A0ABS4RHC6_9BACI|nr:cold shock domain-containing protein [Cytobacillus eiseniae]MBP2242305.1 CspA family cold shock protein [Cytobacillus eiseniae]
MRYNIEGVCKIFHVEEGWGWISIEGEEDAWVHFSNIQMDGFKQLTAGETVLFNLEENPNLKEQSRRAVNVKKIKNKFNKNKR